MIDRVAHLTLLQAIEADLQLAWDHAQEGVGQTGIDQEQFAEHQLRNAIEKVNQIRELKGTGTVPSLKPLRVIGQSGPEANALNQPQPNHEQAEPAPGNNHQ